jgi:hypothetical protein
MSETWLHNDIKNDQILIPGYQEPYRNDRPNRGGGGVCAYVTNNIISKRLRNLEPPSIDLLWLEIPLSNKRIIVGVGYRPPGQNREEVERFLDEFRTSLSNVIALGAESIVLVGDFNDRCTTWDSNHVLSELKNDFYDMLNAFDMVQLVNEITHTSGDTESLLDLIITDSPGFVQSFALLPPLGSKHVTLYLEFKITYLRDKNFTRHVWDYDKGDYENLNAHIINYPWNDIIHSYMDLNSKADNFTNEFLRLCSECIPNRHIRVKPRDLPWMNHTIKRLIRDRDRLYKKLRRTKTVQNETIWKNKAREVRVAINTARLHYRLMMKEKLSDPNLAPKKYWSLVKGIYGSKKGMGIPVIDVGTDHLTTSVDKAIAFTDFFRNQQTLTEPQGHQLPPLVRNTELRLSDISTTPNEVAKILQSLDLGKAHGVDGVSVRLLKETSESISVPLSCLFNESFNKSSVPSAWKKANVSPIHKKDSRSVVGNYRPISLLSTLGKVQERIVYRRLYRFLSDNNLLTPKNSGFKEKDSAIYQLISIVDKIYRALEDGKDISMVFLDVSKAFDKVWHLGLLHKLKTNGIDGKLFEWLEDYLTNRMISVVINGQSAPWAKTNAGVPQGSILGPLLFLVFINDVVDDIESDINLFADDTSLMNIIEQIQDSYATLNRDLEKLSEWADQWLVTYNAAKTVSLHISRRQYDDAHPLLTLKNTPITEVETHRHLGVDLEGYFSWGTHLRRISGKASKCVGLMRRVCRDLPRECLENLYSTMVRPILEYGGLLYDGSPQYKQLT